MKKLRFIVGITAALLLSVNTVLAAETPKATFDGSGEIKYNYSDTENFGTGFGDMLPGEERTQEILLENTYNKSVNFYMEQEVIQAFEDTVNASGAAYEITLDLVKNGETTMIFGNTQEEGARIGGDEEGLANLNQAVEGWVYLTLLEPGETASLQLTVALDGESNTNDYQNAQGTFQFRFRASYDDPETVKGEPTVVKKEVKGDDIVKKVINRVKTGDEAPILGLALLGAGAVCVILILAGKRKRKAEDS